MAGAVLTMTVAAAIDRATGQSHSSTVGAVGIAASVVVVMPAWRAPLARMATMSAIWGIFNVLRALGDDAGMALVPATAVGALETRLFGRPPSAILQSTLPPSLVRQLVDTTFLVVYLSFFLIPVATALIAARSSAASFRRLVVAYALCLALGAVIFAAAPTAPPWMTDPEAVRRLPPALMGDIAAGRTALGPTSGAAAGYGFEPNDLAALPSIHVAAIVLLALSLRSDVGRR